jgi:hypothetical protein
MRFQAISSMMPGFRLMLQYGAALVRLLSSFATMADEAPSGVSRHSSMVEAKIVRVVTCAASG